MPLSAVITPPGITAAVFFICSACHDTEEFPSEDISLAISAQAGIKGFFAQQASASKSWVYALLAVRRARHDSAYYRQ
jgi:hypothetical protein